MHHATVRHNAARLRYLRRDTLTNTHNMERQLPLGRLFDHALLEHQLVHHEAAGQQLALVPDQCRCTSRSSEVGVAVVRASYSEVHADLVKMVPECMIMGINQALREESQTLAMSQHARHGIPPRSPPSFPPHAPEERPAVVMQRLFLAALHRGAILLRLRVTAGHDAQRRRAAQLCGPASFIACTQHYVQCSIVTYS